MFIKLNPFCAKFALCFYFKLVQKSEVIFNTLFSYISKVFPRDYEDRFLD